MTKILCIRYAVVMIGLSLITTILAYVLNNWFGMEWPSGVNLALVFVTAMVTGMTCFSKFDALPDKKTMWKLGFYFTILQFALTVIVMVYLIQVDPVISDLVGQLSLVSWLSIVFFAVLIILLLNRYGFSFGINQAKKLADSKKAKE